MTTKVLLIIRDLANNNTLLTVDESSTVKSVKELYAKKMKQAEKVDDLIFVRNGKQLEDEETLEYHKIKGDDLIYETSWAIMQ